MEKFDERAFLIRSLVAIFAVQLALIGYQNLACRFSVKGPFPSETSSEFCVKLSDNFIETGKSAANVFLALLVPAASLNLMKRPRKTTDKKTNAEEHLEDSADSNKG